MSKPFLSYDQQVDKLIHEKNLVIESREYAISFLKKVSYFALICGYKDPFKNTTTKKYKDGTKIDHIIELYRFDEELRALSLKYIMKIERNVRSLISYYFCETFGDDQKKYLDVQSYDYCTTSPEITKGIDNLVDQLQKLIDSSEHKYICHHRRNHSNVPLWVLSNAMTFGQVAKMYSFLQQGMKSNIARNFDGLMSRDLSKMLGCMTRYRNVCAHGERLFSFGTRDGIPDLTLHKALGIEKRGETYVNGKNDFFALVIMFRKLLYQEDFETFFEELKCLIESYVENQYSLDTDALFAGMGFPALWETIREM